MKNYEIGFIMVPNIVANDSTVSANAKLICGIVNSFSKKNPRVFAKNEFYADFLGIKNVATVSRHISELVHKGYLYRHIKYRIKKGIKTKEIESRFLWVTDKIKSSLKDVKNYWESPEGQTTYKTTIIKDLHKIWED